MCEDGKLKDPKTGKEVHCIKGLIRGMNFHSSDTCKLDPNKLHVQPNEPGQLEVQHGEKFKCQSGYCLPSKYGSDDAIPIKCENGKAVSDDVEKKCLPSLLYECEP